VNGAASVAAVGLAAVFLWAAAAKFVHRQLTVDAFIALRLPAPRPLATAVPVAETGIAAVLFARPDIGGALALAALAVFTIVIVRAFGSGAPCACFGAATAEPVSPADVVRNGLLAAFAAIATGTRALVAPGWAATTAVLAAAAVAVGVQTVVRRRITV
jgi:hypothetical protein